MTEPAGRRSLDQLIARDDPAWPPVLSWAADPDANPSRCFLGDTRAFYADFSELCRWDERPCPGFDEALSFYPFPWSAEAGSDVSRRAVPIDEVWCLKSELAD